MATKEDDFKERFVAVIRDLDEHGRKDPEAMALIGSFAAGLIDVYKLKTWTQFKGALTQPAYTQLLKDFEEQGNKHHREGSARSAYAIQLLAVSVIARTQKDPEVRAGEKLLDQAIDTAVLVHRKARAAGAAKAS